MINQLLEYFSQKEILPFMMQPLVDASVSIIETANDSEQLNILIRLNKTWSLTKSTVRINYGLVVEKCVTKFAHTVDKRGKTKKGG